MLIKTGNIIFLKWRKNKMMKRSKHKETKEIEFRIRTKILIIQNILDSFKDILTNFGPLLKKMLSMEESKLYLKNGNIEKAIRQFDNISKQCEYLIEDDIYSQLLENLKN